MGTVQFSDDGVIDCSGRNQDKKKNFERRKRKLRKAGFDVEDTSKAMSIRMNNEVWDPIAKEQMEKIRVKVPQHLEELSYLSKFQEALQLNDHIWKNMQHHELSEPTPVQRVVIPYVMNTNSDLIVRAQTGSGKTYAYLLPIIDHIIQLKKELVDCSPNSTSPYAIVVAPTRELTFQLSCDAKRLVEDLWRVKVAYSFGELDSRDSEKMLRNGCDILFITPGRLYDYFTNNGHRSPQLNTNNLKYVVLDEADVLADRKKGQNNQHSELPPFYDILYEFICKRLSEVEKRDFRALLFSATLNNPLMYDFVVGANFTEIQVGDEHPVMTVLQSFIPVINEHNKMNQLVEYIEHLADTYQETKGTTPNSDISRKIAKTIIFVNNKRESDRIAHSMIRNGFSSWSINADRSQQQRWQALRGLMDGSIDILVSTDVLSRGINIPRVEYVINFDHPQQFSSQEYIHRVGRCGRIGNWGRAVTFIDPKRDYASALSLIQGCRAVNQEVPKVLDECIRYQNYRHQQQQKYVQRNRQNPQSTGDSGVSSDDSRYSPNHVTSGY